MRYTPFELVTAGGHIVLLDLAIFFIIPFSFQWDDLFSSVFFLVLTASDLVIPGWCFILIWKKRFIIPMKMLMSVLWWYVLHFISMLFFGYDTIDMGLDMINPPVSTVLMLCISSVYSFFYISYRKAKNDTQHSSWFESIISSDLALICTAFIVSLMTHISLTEVLLYFAS